jgi:hypothetical protein
MGCQVVRKNKAVSEVVGTMLLLGIAISLFSVVYIFVFSLPPSEPLPNANLVCRLDENNNIVIDHLGGESLSLNTTLVVTIGGAMERVKVGDFLDEESKEDGYWDFCEQVIYPAGNVSGLEVRADLIDEGGNSVILFGVLQEGETRVVPCVITQDAINITDRSAKLRMMYNFRNFSGFVRFAYRPFGGDWINTTLVQKSGSGSYCEVINNLSSNTLYYFKAQLFYDSLEIDGLEKSFITEGRGKLETSVNKIIPYERIFSPISITASGDTGLDNVTLYYRWSGNNWSGEWITLLYDDLEDGWGNYQDGGLDCCLYRGGYFAYQGRNAANIQDNSGDASSFYLATGVNVEDFSSIKIDFWFIAFSMERGEDFFVEYFDGSTWHIVADYDSGKDFCNYRFYHKIVWINSSDYTFSKDVKIKFRCDASSNWDDVFIDHIYINVSPASTKWKEWKSPHNPDTSFPWSWNFDTPNGAGYYEFYSIGMCKGKSETPPSVPDARVWYSQKYPGIIAYGEQNIPRFRRWNAKAFGGEESAKAAPSGINWIVVKSSPIDPREKIMGVLSSNDCLYIQTWDGNSWVLEWSTYLGRSDVRNFDIAYEKSGDAIVVFGDNSDQLKYRKRIYGVWSTANQRVANLPGTPTWIVAEPDPTSDDIMVAVVDSSFSIVAIRWDGKRDEWKDQKIMSPGTGMPKPEPYPHNEILKTAYGSNGMYRLVADGVGLMDYETGDITLHVPGTPVKAFLYWNGFGPYGDDTISLGVDGGVKKSITGTLIGTCWWYSNKYSFCYKADITPFVSSGTHTYTLSDFSMYRKNGAVILVIYEKHESTYWMEIKDGLDCFYHGHLPPTYPPTGGPDSEVITYYFPPSTNTRKAVVTLIVGGIEGAFRGSAVWMETGKGKQTHTNLVDEFWAKKIAENIFSHNKGREMDVVSLSINIPAGHNFVSLQIESPEDNNGISAHWMASSLEIECGGEKTVGVIDKQCFDVAYESSSGDAFIIWGDSQKNIRYCEFSGSWLQESTAYSTLPNMVYWLEAASDPKSNKISVICMDGFSNIHFGIWTGSSWVPLPKEECGYYNEYKQISTTFVGEKALFAFTTCYCPTKLYWRTWSESSGFSPTVKELYRSSNKIAYIQLFKLGDNLLVVHLDRSRDIEYRRWKGGGFSSPVEIETSASTSLYQCFSCS